MHALLGTRKMAAAVALATCLIGFAPGSAVAKPFYPGVRSSNVHLFAFSVGEYTPNRTQDGLSSRGEFGVDPDGSGTTQGGYWPRGTNDNYIFNSGTEFAGIIQGTKPTNPWGGDTIMAKCFDPLGSQNHCEEVTKVVISTNPTDAANWPDVSRVPLGDTGEALFNPLLQGQIAASQGDAHTIFWDGDPVLIAGRNHPLGLMIEQREMAWNYPAGNEDIVYIIATFYNITSMNSADYSSARPSMQAILNQKASDFQTLNDAKFGITLPTGGYTMGPLFALYGSDEDVGNAGNNYSTVNLPFHTFFAYEAAFDNKGQGGASFDPSVFGPPFFAGFGFIGFRYLQGPTGSNAIALFTNTTNGGALPDPSNSQRFYRIFAGVPTSADGSCNQTLGAGQFTTTIHVCYVVTGTGVDIRSYASSDPLTLAPGNQTSIVVAAIYAAPVQIPNFLVTATTNVRPGNPTWAEFSDSMVNNGGLNTVDSLTGFNGYTGGLLNADGSKHVPADSDFKVVKGSLLDKSIVAQKVFNGKFLLPFAPDPPSFFLIPGEQQVTVLWKPSDTETLGDAFFALASNPSGGLYDPNYRKFDVEGYRVYRGRTDTPSNLQLLQQFDYQGTVFNDYLGNVENPAFPNCAPELGLSGANCAANFAKLVPGVANTVFFPYPLNFTLPTGPLVQVQASGYRALLASGGVQIVLPPDTAVIGGNSGLPPLSDTGVPFVFIDKVGACPNCGVVDGITYFYAVTAFDINSFQSGPSSLSSGPITQSVLVGSAAGNFNNSGAPVSAVVGRHGALTDATVPTLDPVSGEFSKQFPPGNGLQLTLAGFAAAVIKGTGTASMRFDSTVITGITAATSTSFTDYLTLTTSTGSTHIAIPLVGIANPATTLTASGSFTAIPLDPTLTGIFGGGTGFSIGGNWTWSRPGQYLSGVQERGCANTAFGPAASTCFFNGPRWFSGAAESTANPSNTQVATSLNAGGTATAAGTRPDSGYLVAAGSPNIPVNYQNAGSLPGVVVAHSPTAYGDMATSPWRDVDYMLSQFVTAADYHLYWGAAGTIDSVVDITHDQVVAFSKTMGNSWGVLNSTTVAAAGSVDGRGTTLTATDFLCVPPLRSFTATTGTCTQPADSLTTAAVPGQIAFFIGAEANSANPNSTAATGSHPLSPLEANNGFGLYLKGHVFLFELTGGTVPSQGTVWTMRDYVGGIGGGNGLGTNLKFGNYVYYPAPFRPLNEPGAAAQISWNVTNAVVPTTTAMLASVHTVPDPYYVTSSFDATTIAKQIHFVNVPTNAIIRIYSSSGVLIRALQNTTTSNAGTVIWDVRNRSNQFVASGVYFYNVDAGGGITRTARMTIVNLATNAQ